MIKYLVLLLNFIGFLLVDFLFGDLAITINAPAEINAGSSFTVEVTISKSDLKGFARYYQELPIGYSATPINSNNGTFTFKDQKVKLLWNPQLPSDSTFTISYSIKVDPTAEGTLTLGGNFTYLQENEMKTMNIPSKAIIIRPQGFVADNTNNQNNNNNNQQVNNNNSNNQSNNNSNNQQNNNNVTNNFPTNEIFCYRQIIREQGSITVHLLVNTANLSKDKFAKVQERIPEGYTATNINSKDGIFSFKESAAKFLWMALPTDNQFEVSYKLTSSTPSSELPDISGTFSYIENDETKIKTIDNHDFIGAPLIVDNTNNQQQNNNQNNNTNNQNNQSNQQNNNNNVTNNQNNQSNQQNNNQNNNNNNSNNNNVNNNQVSNNNNNNHQTITPPETGIRYKVQIAAGHHPVNPKYYFQQFKVTEPVQMELHEGWQKYTIGSFSIYKDARDRRVQVWQNTPIRDAFVSAYNNGTRITVQEAIMVANQKWYQ